MPQSPIIPVHFEIRGEAYPLAGLVKAVDATTGRRGPSRPMGGWLTVYGLLGPDGGVVPVVDRDDQIMDCAAKLGDIDWSSYLPPKGLWNDTHRDGVIRQPKIIVGVPDTLEYHDGATELSRQHGKVGYWTTGHLFDRDDPSSWEDFTDYRPTPLDLDRADYYWQLANQIFADLPRKLAFSAHGAAGTDPTRRHIIWARITQAAVCEVPKNPASTAEVIVRRPMGPPLEMLAKALDGGTPNLDAVEVPGVNADSLDEADAEQIKKIADYFHFTTDEARAWVRNRIAGLKERSMLKDPKAENTEDENVEDDESVSDEQPEVNPEDVQPGEEDSMAKALDVTDFLVGVIGRIDGIERRLEALTKAIEDKPAANLEPLQKAVEALGTRVGTLSTDLAKAAEARLNDRTPAPTHDPVVVGAGHRHADGAAAKPRHDSTKLLKAFSKRLITEPELDLYCKSGTFGSEARDAALAPVMATL